MNLNTGTVPNWCPGCYNFQILAGVKKYLEAQKDPQKNYAIVTGIGCHAKLFDYVNLNGINTLHGRVIPTATGIKIGDPNLNVLGFSGDGDAYAEGISHLIHAARTNTNINYFVHNNQVFALTVGQPTPTTEQGFKDKTMPLGVKTEPLNPIKLMLASGATFVARVYSDIKQVEWITKEAVKHNGFSFVEIIQPCIIFHPDAKYNEHTYMLADKKHDKSSFEQAMKRAEEFDYNTIDKNTKIPLGIFYQKKKPSFEDRMPQIVDLVKKKKAWKNIKR